MLVGSPQIATSIPGIIRPAIAALIPKLIEERSLMPDMGLNTDARPDVLYQYGCIGTIYSKGMHGIHDPRVALPNIGYFEMFNFENFG
jgi:glycerol-3-phosphate acyltransferase PlsX